MFDFAGFKKYLEDNGIKQTFVAEKIGVTASLFNMILSGRVKCSLEAYVDICRVLKLKFGTFLNMEHSGENTATA